MIDPKSLEQSKTQTSRLYLTYMKVDFNLFSIVTPFDALKYHVFENIIENGAFAPKEQMLRFQVFIT